MKMLLILTNLPDRASAQALAAMLVDEHLAACVNILSPCHSIYRWQGSVECADEVPLQIKTSEARYAQVEAAIRAQHPYATPEIIALPVLRALPDYLAWVGAQTAADQDQPS